MRRAFVANKAFIITLAVIGLAPLWFLFSMSLARASGMFMMPPALIPKNPTLDNYRWALSLAPVAGWVVNTVIVVAITTVLSVLTSASAGYCFSAFKIPKVLFVILLSGLMVPRISMMIPLFMVARKLGISGTLWAVILPTVFSPVGLYLAKTYFDTIPKSLIESARIDGAHEIQILAHVIIPVSRPIITALALFASIGALQDWVWQNLQLQKDNAMTLIVGWIKYASVRNVNGANLNPIGHQLAVGVLLLAPLVALFVVANKYFLQNMEGAVKE